MGTLPDETTRSSPWVVLALRAAGLVVVQDGQGAAPAGDTVEIVRVVDGLGKGRAGGIIVRPVGRGLPTGPEPDGDPRMGALPMSETKGRGRGPSHRQTCHQARRGAGAGGRACRASCKRPSESRSYSPCCSTRVSRPLIRSWATARATAAGDRARGRRPVVQELRKAGLRDLELAVRSPVRL